MKKTLCSCLLYVLYSGSTFAQADLQTDGDWKKQFVSLKNTPEAAVMLRVGDIDNMGFGWAPDFSPFTGKSTPVHGYPWAIDSTDAPGTDRIFVPSGYNYDGSSPYEAYTGYTERPGNLPTAITIPLGEVKAVHVNDAILQLFLDDFQSAELHSKFQVKINGVRFPEAEKVLSNINLEGPVGKLVSFRFTDEMIALLKQEPTLNILIDDPTTGIGDGFSVDFAKLLINTNSLINKGNLTLRIVDAVSRQPIPSATAMVRDFATAVADSEGLFVVRDIPAGLNVVVASAPGYASAYLQTDVISNETGAEFEMELKPSPKVKYNNTSMLEGDSVQLAAIQFDPKTPNLLLTAKTELDNLAAFLKANALTEIMLSYYTTGEVSFDANKDLSLKRLKTCKNYLAKKGIDEGRVFISTNSSFGENGILQSRKCEMKIMR